MKFCSKCGCALSDDTFFCPSCGEKASVLPPGTVQAAAVVDKPVQGETLADKLPGLILLPFLFLAALVFASFSPMFFDIQNLDNIFKQTAINIVLGTGMLITARAKGPDLSIGSIMGFTAVLTALYGVQGSLATGIALSVFLCILIGAANGALTVYFKLPSVFVTLAMMTLLRAASFLLTEGNMIQYPDSDFSFGAQDAVLFIIVLFIIGLLYLLLYTTKLGLPLRQKKDTPARLTDFFAYVIAAVLFGLAGLILLSRLKVGSVVLGTGYEIDFILIIFLCGSSIYFERKPLLPVILVLSCIFYAMLINTFNLLGYSAYIQLAIKALLLFAALACDRMYKKNIVSAFKK